MSGLLGCILLAVTPPSNAISTNPIGLLLGARDFNIEYERTLSTHISLFAQPEYLVRANPLDFFRFTLDGLSLTLGLRYFFGGAAPEGLFVAPRVQLFSVSVQGVPTGGALGAGVGVEGGYTWVFWSRLLLSLGLGANLYRIQATPASGPRQWMSLPLPLARLQLGAAF